MLDKLGQIPLAGKLLHLPIFVPVTDDAAPVPPDLYQQPREAQAVVHQLHHLAAHQLQRGVHDDPSHAVQIQADKAFLNADLGGGDAVAEAGILQALEHILNIRPQRLQLLAGDGGADFIQSGIAQKQNFTLH